MEVGAKAARCKLANLYTELSPEDRDALDYAIDACRKDAATAQPARIFTVAWLTKVLNDNEHPIGKTVVSDHLRKVCACEQPSE